MAGFIGNGSYVKMVWKDGEEAICPRCGNRNACLHTGHLGCIEFYECRDCHLIVAVDTSQPAKDLGPQPPLGRKAIEREGRALMRSLGRSCYKCHGFNLRDMTFDEKADMQRWHAGTPQATDNTICNDCGNTTRY